MLDISGLNQKAVQFVANLTATLLLYESVAAKRRCTELGAYNNVSIQEID